MPWLVTAMAMVDWLEMGVEGIARLTGDCAGMWLVTAVEEILGWDILKLETAMDVVVGVVVEEVEVELEVDVEEAASALLRA